MFHSKPDVCKTPSLCTGDSLHVAMAVGRVSGFESRCGSGSLDTDPEA